jgi:hypothetical protein
MSIFVAVKKEAKIGRAKDQTTVMKFNQVKPAQIRDQLTIVKNTETKIHFSFLFSQLTQTY